MEDERKKGSGNGLLKWFLSIFGLAIVAALLSVGGTYQKVCTNEKNIDKAEIARSEIKREFTSAIDKVNTTLNKMNETLSDQKAINEKIKVELVYIRRNRRNDD
jgi:hypothetical protein